MTVPLRAALYLRVSTARQAEHDVSIPDQKRQGEAYCATRGYQLVETYVEPGASATDDRRPEFQRMIEAGTSRPAPFDIVIVHSFSRFFRDHFELEFYVRKLAKNGVRLVSITQEMGDDPMQVMMRQIMALFDEYQSKENAKHTLRAMQENARQGFWNGSKAPYGYAVVDAEQRGAKTKKRLAIDPVEDRVGQQVKRRILLTGTVMPAGPMDVFAQWRFLDPYAFGDPQLDGSVKRATQDSFKGRYAVLGGYMGHEVVGYRNLDELQRIMGQRAAVARKEDELDLPPVIKVIVPVVLNPTEEQAYRDMKKNLASQLGQTAPGQQSTATNRLTQMMRLRQITSGHLPDDLGVVRQIGTSKVDTMLSVAQDTLAGEKRIVVFCLFTHEFHALMERFTKAAGKGDVIMGISGETETPTRLAYRATFGTPVKDDPRRMILIAQIKTMSISVNELITAQHVLFGSLTQQRDDLIQAIDRLNRIGQEGEKVTTWFFEAPGTIDTVIHKSHDDRTDLENAVLTHILGEDEDAFDRDQERQLNAGTAPLSDEGAHDTHAARAEAIVEADKGLAFDQERDARFPGVSSMSPAEVSAAVGDFNGEDEAPFAAAEPDPEDWPPASAVPAPAFEPVEEEDDIEDLTVLG